MAEGTAHGPSRKVEIQILRQNVTTWYWDSGKPQNFNHSFAIIKLYDAPPHRLTLQVEENGSIQALIKETDQSIDLEDEDLYHILKPINTSKPSDTPK